MGAVSEQGNADLLLETLRGLETLLHQPEVRADAERLGACLHADFLEFGRSGARYTRAEVVASIAGTAAQQRQPSIWTQDFELASLGEGVALLTYRSAHRDEGGALSRHTHRSSLWLLTEDGWRLRFHQGTPTEAFEQKESRP